MLRTPATAPPIPRRDRMAGTGLRLPGRTAARPADHDRAARQIPMKRNAILLYERRHGCDNAIGRPGRKIHSELGPAPARQ